MSTDKKPKIRYTMSAKKTTSNNMQAKANMMASQAKIDAAKGDNNMKTLIGMSLLLVGAATLVSVIISVIAG